MPKIYNANRRETTDGTAANFLTYIPTDVPLVLVARADNYRFNEDLYSLKDKKWVLCCFTEYGWDWKFSHGTHLWGVNTKDHYQFADNLHWEKFDEFVRDNPPALTFKRELLKKDVVENILPIEYPCWFEPKEIQVMQQFYWRPIEAFYFWGRSHEARLKLHANIWRAASDKGFSVCDNIHYFEKFLEGESGKKWVSLNIPHYSRIDVREIIGRQALSKLSIAMPGAGIKTFRHCEASVNSVMVKWKDDLAWTHEWDETNCILTEEGKEIEDIFTALSNPKLYEIYREGVANCQKYQINTYSKYLADIISKL